MLDMKSSRPRESQRRIHHRTTQENNPTTITTFYFKCCSILIGAKNLSIVASLNWENVFSGLLRLRNI